MMDESRPARRRRWRRTWLLLIIPAVVGMIWYGSRATGYVATHRAFIIPSGSMAPAILPGDRIVVDLNAGKPNRGEIWAFDGPNKTTLIKRVIGLPGETIEVAGVRVLIDGKPLDEPYLAGPTTSPMPPVRLGPDEYFLMGDSRPVSSDSRAWGPVHLRQFVGRAEHRFWPSSRIGPLH